MSYEFFSKRCTCCIISYLQPICNWRYWDLKKLHEHVVITSPVPMFQSNRVLYERYDNFMPGNFISGFKLEIQYPLAKMPWKYVSHYDGWPTKKTVSWIVIRTSKYFDSRFGLSALLIVFCCIISLLIAFHCIVLLIAFSK